MSEKEDFDKEKEENVETPKVPKLIVEGGLKVLYEGEWVSEVPFDTDEISVGVCDELEDIYPDIDLYSFRVDGGDPYISRQHAKFIRRDNKYFIKDLCSNNSTSINEKSNVINSEEFEMVSGTRVFISESLVFRFEHPS